MVTRCAVDVALIVEYRVELFKLFEISIPISSLHIARSVFYFSRAGEH